MESKPFSRHYRMPFIIAVAGVAMVLAVAGWLARDRTLALSAGVVGLYSLHLMSIRYILEGQSNNKARLDTQWKLLQLLVDPNAARGDEEAAAALQSAREIEAAEGDEVLTIAEADHEEGALNGGAPGKVPTPRHFALGTVALIRNLLTPSQVAQILIEQRHQPDEKFAAIAVDLGMLSPEQREELLLAQQEGLFTDQEMRQARERLTEFRRATADALATQR